MTPFNPDALAREWAEKMNAAFNLYAWDDSKDEAQAMLLSFARALIEQSGAECALKEDIISARIIHSEAEHNGKWAIQRDCAFIEGRCRAALANLRAVEGKP